MEEAKLIEQEALQDAVQDASQEAHEPSDKG
jgi:hypothetical protein